MAQRIEAMVITRSFMLRFRLCIIPGVRGRNAREMQGIYTVPNGKTKSITVAIDSSESKNVVLC